MSTAVQNGNDRLLTKKQLAAIIGVSPRTLQRMVQDGSIPKPVRLAQQVIRWLPEDIQAWRDQGCPKAFVRKNA